MKSNKRKSEKLACFEEADSEHTVRRKRGRPPLKSPPGRAGWMKAEQRNSQKWKCSEEQNNGHDKAVRRKRGRPPLISPSSRAGQSKAEWRVRRKRERSEEQANGSKGVVCRKRGQTPSSTPSGRAGRMISERSNNRKCESSEERDGDDENVLCRKRDQSSVSPLPNGAGCEVERGPTKHYRRCGIYHNCTGHKRRCGDDSSAPAAKRTKFSWPTPMYYGARFVSQEEDFLLPHDIWWQYEHGKLRPKPIVAEKYRKIRSNVYTPASQTSSVWEPSICFCEHPSDPTQAGCGEDCINRQLMVECVPRYCPCGEQCSNQRFQRREWSTCLQRFLTPQCGFGIRTTKPIAKGEFIIEYVGEVINEPELRRRQNELYVNQHNHYCLSLDGGLVIDSTAMGCEARFVNHSCSPNCEMQKWFVCGQHRMGLFALEDILEGAELSYDYRFDSFDNDEQVCYCKAEACRGFLCPPKKAEELVQTLLDNAVENKRKKSRRRRHASGVEAELVSPMVDDCKVEPPKLMGKRDRLFCLRHKILLVRNVKLSKLWKELLERSKAQKSASSEADNTAENDRVKASVFMSHFRALDASNPVRTRQLVACERDEALARTVHLAKLCRQVLTELFAFCDASGHKPSSTFRHLPPRKSHPEYYKAVREPIDLKTIEQQLLAGHYRSRVEFEGDIERLLGNALMYYRLKEPAHRDAVSLQQVYIDIRSRLEPDFAALNSVVEASTADSPQSLNDNPVTVGAVSSKREEVVIDCPCGVNIDEGLMVQCDRCEAWQHCLCISFDTSQDDQHFLCECCGGSPPPREVQLYPQPAGCEPNCTYYRCVKFHQRKVHLGSTVYLSRQSLPNGTLRRLSREEILSSTDIFRVLQLWRDSSKDNAAFMYGYYYLRPNETYPLPSKRFFKNEVIQSPHQAIVPVADIRGFCCVLDGIAFRKGVPIGYKPNDVYICELRCNKSAKQFQSVPRTRCQFPASLAKRHFRHFDMPARPMKTFRVSEDGELVLADVLPLRSSRSTSFSAPEEEILATDCKEESRCQRQRERLEAILQRLLPSLPPPLDEHTVWLKRCGLARRRACRGPLSTKSVVC